MSIASRKWAGFRSVLCAVDFSEHARLALRYAEAIALRRDARLTVAYVNDPLLVAAAAVALHDRHFAERSATELQEFVAGSLTARARKQLNVKSVVAIGRPAPEILKAAGRWRSDLLVLGTHGLTGADRLLMGSTTLGVLQRTTVPVLAVPRPPEGVTTVSTSWPARIVAALDLDADSTGEVDAAARIAQWFGSSLQLLHVVTKVAAPAWVKGDLSAHERIRIGQAQQQLDRLAAAARRRVKTDARVICGAASDEIAAYAVTERAGLLMTALRRRHRWFGASRGSISYHVLSHAVAPVLACPPGWRAR